MSHFKQRRFDAGLTSAVALMEQSLTAPSNARVNGHVPAAPAPGGRAGNVHGARFGVGSLLMIGLGIFAVLILLRALGGLFGRSGGGYSSPMGMGGMPRPGMGPGPGYGQPGYGGYGAPRGGGFFSGMLGGLGGALAGNWLYDQFSGRHGSPGQTDAGSYIPTESTSAYDPAGDAPVGADDDRRHGSLVGTTRAQPIPAAIGAAATAEPTGAVVAAIGAVVAATAAETGSLWLAGRLPQSGCRAWHS